MPLHLTKRDTRAWLRAVEKRERARHTAPLDALELLLKRGWVCVGFDPATKRRTLRRDGVEVEVGVAELVAMAMEQKT